MNGCVIPSTPIAVDFWKLRDCPSARVFFLTHLHGDHITGLTSSWSFPIYCSETSERLLVLKHGIKPDLIRTLEVDSPQIVHLDADQKEQMTVTALEANHCPGAVMFLFQGYFGTILHTGDFRFDPQMITPGSTLAHVAGDIDVLYLDNTYCSPGCVFPSRDECIEWILSIISSKPNHDVVIGMRNLGKEELLYRTASQFHEWLSVPPKFFSTLEILGAPNVFKNDADDCRIKVVPFHRVSNKYMNQLNMNRPTIAILPTALYCGIDARPFENQKNVFVVPYSDHSSYKELVRFVSLLKPRKIIPIVKKTSRGPFGISIADRADMSCFDNFLSVDEESSTTVQIPPSVSAYMKDKSAVNLPVTRRGSKRKGKNASRPGSSKAVKRGVVYESPNSKQGGDDIGKSSLTTKHSVSSETPDYSDVFGNKAVSVMVDSEGTMWMNEEMRTVSVINESLSSPGHIDTCLNKGVKQRLLYEISDGTAENVHASLRKKSQQIDKNSEVSSTEKNIVSNVKESMKTGKAFCGIVEHSLTSNNSRDNNYNKLVGLNKNIANFVNESNHTMSKGDYDNFVIKHYVVKKVNTVVEGKESKDSHSETLLTESTPGIVSRNKLHDSTSESLTNVVTEMNVSEQDRTSEDTDGGNHCFHNCSTLSQSFNDVYDHSNATCEAMVIDKTTIDNVSHSNTTLEAMMIDKSTVDTVSHGNRSLEDMLISHGFKVDTVDEKQCSIEKPMRVSEAVLSCKSEPFDDVSVCGRGDLNKVTNRNKYCEMLPTDCLQERTDSHQVKTKMPNTELANTEISINIRTSACLPISDKTKCKRQCQIEKVVTETMTHDGTRQGSQDDMVDEVVVKSEELTDTGDVLDESLDNADVSEHGITVINREANRDGDYSSAIQETVGLRGLLVSLGRVNSKEKKKKALEDGKSERLFGDIVYEKETSLEKSGVVSEAVLGCNSECVDGARVSVRGEKPNVCVQEDKLSPAKQTNNQCQDIKLDMFRPMSKDLVAANAACAEMDNLSKEYLQTDLSHDQEHMKKMTANNEVKYWKISRPYPGMKERFLKSVPVLKRCQETNGIKKYCQVLITDCLQVRTDKTEISNSSRTSGCLPINDVTKCNRQCQTDKVVTETMTHNVSRQGSQDDAMRDEVIVKSEELTDTDDVLDESLDNADVREHCINVMNKGVKSEVDSTSALLKNVGLNRKIGKLRLKKKTRAHEDKIREGFFGDKVDEQRISLEKSVIVSEAMLDCKSECVDGARVSIRDEQTNVCVQEDRVTPAKQNNNHHYQDNLGMFRPVAKDLVAANAACAEMDNLGKEILQTDISHDQEHINKKMTANKEVKEKTVLRANTGMKDKFLKSVPVLNKYCQVLLTDCLQVRADSLQGRIDKTEISNSSRTSGCLPIQDMAKCSRQCQIDTVVTETMTHDGTRQGSRVDMTHDGTRQGSRVDMTHDGTRQGSQVDMTHDGTRQGSLVDMTHDGTRQGSRVDMTHDGTRQGSRVDMTHDGTRQGSQVDMTHDGTRQGSRVDMTHDGTRQGSRVDMTHDGTRQDSRVDMTHDGTRQGSQVDMTHDGTRQGSQVDMTHDGTRQGSQVDMTHDGTRQDSRVDMTHDGTRQDSRVDMTHDGTRQDSRVDMTHDGTRQDSRVDMTHDGTRQGSRVDMTHDGTRQGSQVDMTHDGTRQGSQVDMTHDGSQDDVRDEVIPNEIPKNGLNRKLGKLSLKKKTKAHKDKICEGFCGDKINEQGTSLGKSEVVSEAVLDCNSECVDGARISVRDEQNKIWMEKDKVSSADDIPDCDNEPSCLLLDTSDSCRDSGKVRSKKSAICVKHFGDLAECDNESVGVMKGTVDIYRNIRRNSGKLSSKKKKSAICVKHCGDMTACDNGSIGVMKGTVDINGNIRGDSGKVSLKKKKSAVSVSSSVSHKEDMTGGGNRLSGVLADKTACGNITSSVLKCDTQLSRDLQDMADCENKSSAPRQDTLKLTKNVTRSNIVKSLANDNQYKLLFGIKQHEKQLNKVTRVEGRNTNLTDKTINLQVLTVEARSNATRRKRLYSTFSKHDV